MRKKWRIVVLNFALPKMACWVELKIKSIFKIFEYSKTVEKSVARVAQECFLNSGINLILNVKGVIMEKLSRVLQAEPMINIDDINPARKPKLGFCSHFHIDTFQMPDQRAKSLMFFEGTPTNLGCTVVLRGGSINELSLVKRIIRFMVYVVYNSKLEQSFILDKYADFNLKNTIFDVSKNESFFELDKMGKNDIGQSEKIAMPLQKASNNTLSQTLTVIKNLNIT